MAGSLKLDGSEFLVKEGGQFKITNSELKLKSSGNTIVDSSGNAVVSESGGNVTLGNVRLPATGGIKDSSGNNILTESAGTVTATNVAIDGSGYKPAEVWLSTTTINSSTTNIDLPAGYSSYSLRGTDLFFSESGNSQGRISLYFQYVPAYAFICCHMSLYFFMFLYFIYILVFRYIYISLYFFIFRYIPI